MDLKTALKDILPKLVLKPKHSTSEPWAIDRPVEFHECYTCDEMVDQRIVDVVCITCTDDFALSLCKKYNKWCAMHNDPSLKEECSKAKPCKRCYRWTLTHTKGGVCSMCRHNPWTTTPPPMIARRPWYKVTKEEECDTTMT